MSDICLVVIARDEARCIGRCLESAAPFVDRILVLDTGSKDDTPAIARTHGAIVHSFPWTGDFSQARNKSLSLADADWNLVLDADEWIAPGMSREVLQRHMDSSKAGGLKSMLVIESRQLKRGSLAYYPAAFSIAAESTSSR